jgi:two-component system response regulator (stage 0 sporulation protein F)
VALKERILIVEEDSTMAQVLCRALSLPQGGGYRVETCGSAEAALERLRDAHFDLLIAALCLPDMSGLELVERTRQLSPDTRSILITAFGSPQIEEQALRLADAHIPKLFCLRDIIRVVHHILGEPDAHGQSCLGEDAAGHHAAV